MAGHEYPVQPEKLSDGRHKVSLWVMGLSLLIALVFNRACEVPFRSHQDSKTMEIGLPGIIFILIASWGTALGLYYVILKQVYTNLWKSKSFRWMLKIFGFEVPPIIAGDYPVKVNWSRPQSQSGKPNSGEVLGTMSIFQTWDKIFVRTVFQDQAPNQGIFGESRSHMAVLEKISDCEYELFYTYRFSEVVQGNGLAVHDNILSGTCTQRFSLCEDSGILSFIGRYFSSDSGSGTIVSPVDLQSVKPPAS